MCRATERSSAHRARLRTVALSLVVALGGGCGPKDASPPPASKAAGDAGLPPRVVVTPAQSTFKVEWKPETHVFDAAEVAASYRGVADDRAFTFEGELAKKISALPPYAIIVLPGVAIRRIARVQQDGARLHVFTGPVALDDAISEGQIKWQMPFDFRKVAIAMPPGFHAADRAALAKQWRDLFIPAAYADEPGYNYQGSVQDWDVTLSITPQNGDLKFDLDAKKSIGGGTIEVHGIGELDSLTNSVQIMLANGSTTQIDFENSNLHGKLDFTWDASFDKDHGGSAIDEFNKQVVVNLPLGFTLPFVVGPLPFKLEFKSAFAFAPIFSSRTTVAHGESHMSFGGSASASNPAAAAPAPAAASAAPSPPPPGAGSRDPANSTGASPSLQADASIGAYGGTLSVAPLGLSTTVAMPKITLTLGVSDALDSVLDELKGLGGILGAGADGAKGAEGMARSDALTNGPGSFFSKVMGKQDKGPYMTVMLRYDFVATGPNLIAACERRELKALAMVGVDASLLGKDLGSAGPTTILEKNYKTIIPANIRLCQE